MNLIYVMAVGQHDPRFLESVQWCVASLRRWGRFEGELIVVNDRGNQSIADNLGALAKVIEVDADRLCDPAHARSPRDRYQMARLCIHEIIDLSAYDTVMYVDADVLAIRDVNPLFEGVQEFRYAREFQVMSAPAFNASLTNEELGEARWRRGINSGVFVAPAAYLPECLAAWKKELDAAPSGNAYDQPALNAVVFRNLIRTRPLPALSVAYPVYTDFPDHFRPHTRILHYCGNRQKKFARMRRHFDSLQNGTQLQIHFGIDEDLDMPDFTRAKWQHGDEQSGLTIGVNDDMKGVEVHALINQHWSRELHKRGHHVVTIGADTDRRPDVVLHHNFKQDFCEAPFVSGAAHIAVRTSDFGPHPREWVDRINSRYDQLWVYSQWIRDHAIEGGVDPSRVRVVPLGFDPTVFRPTGNDDHLPTKKRCRFLYVGGAVKRKGIDILLKAYTSEFGPDDDVCLVIKDHGPNLFYRQNPYRSEIQELAADPWMPEIVYLNDHLPSLELASLYRSCTVGVWPYRAEGFLIPPLECMACGTPTVLPDIGPTNDFSSDRTSFLVQAYRIQLPCRRRFRMRLNFEIEVESIDIIEVKVDELRHAMRSVSECGDATLKDKSAAAVAMAHGQFTWEHSADRIEQCLSELVST